MTKQELLDRFFRHDENEKQVVIFCETDSEIRNVMYWFLDNTDMTVECDSFAQEVLDEGGIVDDWCCVESNKHDETKFDFYSRQAMSLLNDTIDFIPAQEFFAIVDDKNDTELTKCPLSILFGEAFEKGA